MGNVSISLEAKWQNLFRQLLQTISWQSCLLDFGVLELSPFSTRKV